MGLFDQDTVSISNLKIKNQVFAEIKMFDNYVDSWFDVSFFKKLII